MLIERYRRWYEYERDCNAKVLAALQAVPEEQRTAEGFARSLTLLGHMLAARELWLWRLGAGGERPSAFFPEGVPLDDLVARVQRVEAAWSSYLQQLDDAALDRTFEYKALDGDPFRNRIEDILTQLFGHAWYHRGQIAVNLRALGATPPITDFVYWCREPLPREA